MVFEHYVPDTGTAVEGHKDEKDPVSILKKFSLDKGLSLLRAVQWLPIASKVESQSLTWPTRLLGDLTFAPLSSLTLLQLHWASSSSSVRLNLLPSLGSLCTLGWLHRSMF